MLYTARFALGLNCVQLCKLHRCSHCAGMRVGAAECSPFRGNLLLLSDRRQS